MDTKEYTKENPLSIKSFDEFKNIHSSYHFYVRIKCDKCEKTIVKTAQSLRNMIKNNDPFYCGPCLRKKKNLELHGLETYNNQEKTIETCLNRYGVKNISQTKESRQKISDKVGHGRLKEEDVRKKKKETNLKKYGVDNPAKSDDIKEKTATTNLKLYGGIAPSCNTQVREKMRITNIKKFGEDSTLWPGAIASRKKFIEYRDSILDEDLEWLDKEKFKGKYADKPIYYSFKCRKCGTQFEDDFHSGWPICRKCHTSLAGISKEEKDLVSYIKSIYSGKIIENDRKVIGKELDIWLPELNIAIEYDGHFYHGYSKYTKEVLSKFKKKLEEKRLLCRSKNIRLITIDDYDYNNRPEVFNRFISDTILPRKRIFARKCIFKEIDTKKAKDFCLYYHLNGFRGGEYKYGLFYENELVCVAIFGKYRKGYECIRLCYKTGISIIGGWEKIQKNFGKDFLTYINLKYFMGDNKTGIGFRFVRKNLVLHRNSLQKKTGLNKYCKNIDPKLSDFYNCIQNGFICSFDLGNDIRYYKLT
jgi:hypothetical protein